MKNQKLFILIAIIIFIIATAAWYIYRDLKKSEWKETPHTPEMPIAQVNNNSEINDGAKNNQPLLSAEEIKRRMPNLDGEIIIKISLTTEAKLRAISDIKNNIANLKKDYNQREEWLNLGLLRKQIGDYDGAKEVWEFVTILRPKDAVAYHNLGDLYWMNLNNYPMAEKYFLKAIEKDPSGALYYTKLHELYRYSYKEKQNLAEDVLVKGVKADPDSVYLKSLLEQYRKEIGK